MCHHHATWAARQQVDDKVVVELREWESRHTNPEGEIIEVLGPPDAEGWICFPFSGNTIYPLHFSKSVLHEARSFGTTIQPRDLKRPSRLPLTAGHHHRSGRRQGF
jgi:exoribonuclease R